jgi:hypothetical protein
LTDAEQIARLRVAIATGRLPPDLGAWTLARVVETLEAAERRAQRNALLRAAGDCLGGSRYARAVEVLDIIREFDRAPGLLKAGWFHEETPHALVQAALRLHPKLPRTRRYLLHILARR